MKYVVWLGVLSALAPSVAAADVQAIEDNCAKKSDSGCAQKAMDAFYRELLRVENKEAGAVARVSHFGDSITADDIIAGRARERLQAKFGDGGAGFLYLASPHGAYHRTGARTTARGWKKWSVIHGGKRDGLYGFGGATFEGGAGASAMFSTESTGAMGNGVARFELYYLEQPKGGTLALEVDGKVATTLTTTASRNRSAWRQLEVPDGEHTLRVRVQKGRARGFGVVMERQTGVVWENLGLVSGSARAWAANQSDHWRAQIDHRAPHLVVVFLGANESEWTASRDEAIDTYQTTFESILADVRSGRPDASCLVMSPLDSADVVDGKLTTKRVLPKMIAAQRRAAEAEGCAFWDAYSWMGGKGSMAKWRRRGWGARDLTHISRKAARKLADALVDALLEGYEEYKRGR